jgi:hypothetical protein
MSDDRHRPTTAGPMPEPTPTVTVVGASPSPPEGTATYEPSSGLPFGIPEDRPEILVGAAFAGGIVAAFILKRLGGD